MAVVARGAVGAKPLKAAVDFKNRRPVAGLAPTIRAVPDGPPALPELGAFWRQRASAAGTG